VERIRLSTCSMRASSSTSGEPTENSSFHSNRLRRPRIESGIDFDLPNYIDMENVSDQQPSISDQSRFLLTPPKPAQPKPQPPIENPFEFKSHSPLKTDRTKKLSNRHLSGSTPIKTTPKKRKLHEVDPDFDKPTPQKSSLHPVRTATPSILSF